MKIYNVLRIVFLIQFGFFVMLLSFSGCKGGEVNVEDVVVNGDVSETVVIEEALDQGTGEVEGEEDVKEVEELETVKEGEVGAGDVEEELVEDDDRDDDDEEHVEDDDEAGDERPEDMPSIAGASDFTWAGAVGSGMLSFKINGNKFDEVCESQSDLIIGKGWILKEDVDGQFEGTATKKYEKEGFTLSLTCTEQMNDKETVTVTMVKGAQ